MSVAVEMHSPRNYMYFSPPMRNVEAMVADLNSVFGDYTVHVVQLFNIAFAGRITWRPFSINRKWLSVDGSQLMAILGIV